MMKNLNQSSAYSILLVENSKDESDLFIDIVKNQVNAQIHFFLNSFEAIQWLQENKVEILVIAEDARPMNASQTTDYIRQELKLDIPVFITSSSTLNVSRKHISKPFTKKSLAPLLYFSEDEKDTGIEPALYSLDYLKEISGGNVEFIHESIEIFKSSVKKQLQELQIASDNNDNEKAARIAHNIKPSFEMLENQEGTEICNKLTYDLENQSLSELVSNLKILFDKIIKQLESNFIPKKI